MKLNKAIKFEELIEKYNRLSTIIHHILVIFIGKLNTNIGSIQDVNLIIQKKAWKWLKATTKVDKFKNMLKFSSKKQKMVKLATST